MFKVPGNSEIMPGGPEGLVKKLVFVLELNLNRWKWPEVGEEGHSAGGRGVLLEKGRGGSWRGAEEAGWEGGLVWEKP